MDYRTYRVSERSRGPLLAFIRRALENCGCRIISTTGADVAPFRISFESPDGERAGIVAYAFFAGSRLTRNRPTDEHRFQVKYGPDDKQLHALWQDPFGLYTTLFLGIDPERGLFVGVDPVLHSPTRFFISIEYKDEHVERIQRDGWVAWERAKRGAALDEPTEILVGGVPENFLRYVRFERAAVGLDAGHRQLLADKLGLLRNVKSFSPPAPTIAPSPQVLHRLTEEMQLSETELMDLIQSAPRLKMAVRGWVAEVHLERHLVSLPSVEKCKRIEEEGGPDLEVKLKGIHRPILIECKNVLREPTREGTPRVDFQRTRASKGDPCTRFYKAEDFDVLAACLHPLTEDWEFEIRSHRRFGTSQDLPGQVEQPRPCQSRLV